MAGMRSFVVELAKTGGRIAREHFATVKQKDVRTKASRDYVSHVDSLVEDAIIRRIRAHYPDHAILGEESGGDISAPSAEGQPYWIIDPIDGTTNFIHGIPAFCVSIAFCDGEAAQTGVVFDPMRDEIFIGERGSGLWLNNERVSSSGCAQLERALIATAMPFRFPQALQECVEVFTTVQRLCDDQRRSGSAALDLAYTATGRLDGYYELGIYPWDTAAGELLVQCGGGMSSDYRGVGSGLSKRRSLVAAATPQLHAQMLAQVARLAPWLDRAPFV